MRVLALVPGGIDDQLRFFPTLNHLKAAFETAEIAVAAPPEAKDVYRLSKVVTEVIPYSFQMHNSPADWANLLGIVRDREFEVVLTLTQSWSIGLLLWLSGVPTRVGYAGGANDLLLTDTVPLKAEQPLVSQYHDLLQAIELPGAVPALTINVPQSDIRSVETLRQTANLSSGYVLVYPGTTETGDTYSTERWLTILKDLQQRQPSIPTVLLRTAASASAITAINESLPGLTVLEPETTGQMAALIAGANLLIAVNSYPLYLATALQVYALGLFGGDDPDKLLPVTAGDEQRVLALTSSTDQLDGIPADAVLKKIWNG
jgi:ADP-heptose:LPS heptosyltransferase